jgi:toxin ParE1/3/4
MRSYRLAKQADRDVIDIYSYGLEIFGARHADAYHGRLQTCFELLASQPGLGQRYGIATQQVRVFFHESHVIVYQVATTHVLIARVLSMRRNWRRILPNL